MSGVELGGGQGEVSRYPGIGVDGFWARSDGVLLGSSTARSSTTTGKYTFGV
ncbi:MAG TPA: hypothetical protein VMU77_01675 [Acidimicrobiales bacterium]|nr:hypothetical protein [Acidimicrobiales bacterium]